MKAQGVDNGILWNSTNTVYVLSDLQMFPILFFIGTVLYTFVLRRKNTLWKEHTSRKPGPIVTEFTAGG